MTTLTDQELKTLRKHLIKTIKERVKPYLKDSEYLDGMQESYGSGKPVKLCLLKRPVRLKFLDLIGESANGFTDKELVLRYGLDIETISFKNICIEDLQVLAGLDLDFLVKVQKPARPMSSRKKTVKYIDVGDNNH